MDFEFTTDGCSLFPDGDYGGCCVEHDKAYWRGGTAAERKAADAKLAACVAAKGHWYSKILGKMMYLGVQLFGAPWFPTWYRWGYGWKYSKAWNYAKQAKLPLPPK